MSIREMFERVLRRMSPLRSVLALSVGLLAAGCGSYEPEPAYPVGYTPAPPPPTAAELAAQQQAREQEAAASREIVIGADEDEYADTDPSALTEFKPALEGHGTWVDDSTYGTVWVPSKEEVGEDFQPYVTAGSWSYSDTTDYVWVSDYSWGWVPFHYGRWVLLPGHGWSWIPGRRYAGAWVTWRVGPAGYGYVGWAPMAPSWYWVGGYPYGWSFGFYDYNAYYVYCPHDHFYHHGVGGYVARGPAAREHYGRTRDYVPARPSTGGGAPDRVIARPGVGPGDRVVAQPSVSDRVNANPSVAHSVSGVRGPRPSELGMKDETVLAPPTANQGLSRAQAFATPKSAIAAGAAPPVGIRPMAAPMPGNGMGAVVDSPRSSTIAPFAQRDLPPVNSSSSSSSYAASIRHTPVPQFVPPATVNRPAPTPQYSAQPPMRSNPTFGSSSAPSPVARSAPSMSSSPSFHSSPAPIVHSAPTPTIRSTPSMSSSPSFHSSAPSPVARSAPSVSAAPVFRSAPARSAPSRPSVSRPSSSRSIRR